MLTRILIAFCVCLASTNAMAQASIADDEVKIEVSGGYAYAWGDVRRATGGDTLPKGWNGGFVLFFSEGVGFNVDIAGHYGKQFFGSQAGTQDASLHTYLAGVKLTHPLSKIEITARLLGGIAQASGVPGGEPENDTEVAIMFGGGLNLPMGRFGIQLIQFDILLSGAVREVTPAVTVGAFYRW